MIQTPLYVNNRMPLSSRNMNKDESRFSLRDAL